MKRKFIFALILAMMLVLSGCGGSEKKKKPISTPETTISENQEDTKNTDNVVDNITIMYHDRSAVGSYVKNLVSIYGKEEFDRIRYEKKLMFLPL